MLPDLSRFRVAPPEDPNAPRFPMLNSFRLPGNGLRPTINRPASGHFDSGRPYGGGTLTNPDGSPYYLNFKQATDAGIRPPGDATPGHHWSWDAQKQRYGLSPNHGQTGLGGFINNTLMSNNNLLNPVGSFLKTRTGQDLVMNSVLYGPAVVGAYGALSNPGTGAGAGASQAAGAESFGWTDPAISEETIGAGSGYLGGGADVGLTDPFIGGAGVGAPGAGAAGDFSSSFPAGGSFPSGYGAVGGAGTGSGVVGTAAPASSSGLRAFLLNYGKPISAGLGVLSDLGGKTASERGLAGIANAGYDSGAIQKFLPAGLRNQNIDPTLAAGLAHIAELLNNPGGLSPEVSDAIRARLAAESSNIEQNYRGIASNQAGAAARSNLPVSIRGALQSALDIAQERAQRGARQDALTESDTLRRQDLEQTYKLLDTILQFTSSGRGQSIQGLSASSHNEQQQQAAMLAFIGSLLSGSGRT